MIPRRYLLEAFVTFLYTFAFFLTLQYTKRLPLFQLALFRATFIFILVYLTSYIDSDGIINPLATLTYAWWGKITLNQVLPFVIAQVIGTVAAVYLAKLVVEK